MVISPREDVDKILTDMRKALSQNKFIPVKRHECTQTLAALGMLWRDIIPVLKALTYDNYCNGPEVDYGRPDEDKLWVFKTQIDSAIIYIKFKVEYMVDGAVKVISFHFDDRF